MKRRYPKTHKLAMPLAAVAACGLQTASMPVQAQQAAQPAEPEKMEKVVVTGSVIPTADTVGPAAVETVSAETIQQIGSTDVLSVLKKISPSFSGNGNVGQTLNNGGFGESYIALRNLPTLVLLDGKRLNITPFSTYVGTFSADLNTIPVAMIDHIEVLKDGASTIYGSDAIGGVVNIITKKNFNGFEVDGRYGFATGTGTYNEARASAIWGLAQEGTRINIGLNYYYSDPLRTADRPIGGLDPNTLKANNFVAPSYFSGSFPGRVGSFIFAGSPLAQGSPGYNAKLAAAGTPPVFAGQHYNSVADYNAAALANPAYVAAYGATAPYIPITSLPAEQALHSTAILNTTTLGTLSIQQQDRRTAFANFEQDIFKDTLTFYSSFLVSRNESKGKLAPSPVPSLDLYNIFIPANNIYNPFGIDLGAGAPQNLSMRTRTLEVGNRVFDANSDSFHGVGGIKGDVFTKYHYDISADYSMTQQKQYQTGASSILLNQALTPVGASSALGVPLYNPFGNDVGPAANGPQTVNAIKATGFQGGFSDLLVVEGAFRGEVFNLPAGPFQAAVGAQYMSESLSTTADALLASGNLIGLNSLPTFAGGNRDREAGFVEAQIPVIGPDQNITGVHKFDINASGRFETIESANTSHSSLVPKVGFRWQPIDEQWTIRGTYSQGFVVPPLTQLYGPPLNSNPYVVAPDDSLPAPYAPVAAQQTVNYLSNPNLPPSTSETMSLGVVMSPKFIKGLTVSVDYYHVEQPSIGFYPSPSAVVADLNKNGAASKYVNTPAAGGTPIFVDGNGNAYLPNPADPASWLVAGTGNGTPPGSLAAGVINLPLLAGGSQRTEGVDLAADYRLETESAGKFDFFASANVSMSWDIKLGKGTPWISYNGLYTDSQAVAAAQGMIPEYSVTAGFTWSIMNFDYTVTAHYLPGVHDPGDMHPSVGALANDFTQNGKSFEVADYYKVDMQLAYNFRSDSGKKWYDNTRIAVGCDNISDNLPPLIASSSEDNTDKSSYDILGRFVYVELSKKF